MTQPSEKATNQEENKNKWNVHSFPPHPKSSQTAKTRFCFLLARGKKSVKSIASSLVWYKLHVKIVTHSPRLSKMNKISIFTLLSSGIALFFFVLQSITGKINTTWENLPQPGALWWAELEWTVHSCTHLRSMSRNQFTYLHGFGR